MVQCAQRTGTCLDSSRFFSGSWGKQAERSRRCCCCCSVGKTLFLSRLQEEPTGGCRHVWMSCCTNLDSEVFGLSPNFLLHLPPGAQQRLLYIRLERAPCVETSCAQQDETRVCSVIALEMCVCLQCLFLLKTWNMQSIKSQVQLWNCPRLKWDRPRGGSSLLRSKLLLL